MAINKELIAADANNVERKIASLSLQISLSDVTFHSEKQYKQTLAEGNALYSAGQRNKNLIIVLKRLHSRIGNLFSYRAKYEEKEGNLDTARNWFAQTLEHRERDVHLTEKHPDAITEKRWIYSAYFSYAETLTRLGRITEALENLEIAEKILQDLKKNTDDRELALLEIWSLNTRLVILKRQDKPEAALAVAQTGLNIALERTEADPTNIEPISAMLNLANEAAKLASELKRERQAEGYRQIQRKYEPQYREKFGGDFSYVF